MIIMAHISDADAVTYRGAEFAPDSYCNPVQDKYGRWCVSLIEADSLGLDYEPVKWEAPIVAENEIQ
jgi:hypothetical protein